MQSLKLCGPDPRPITKEEALALSQIAKQLPPNPVIVQIGAYWGVSTAVMLETRPDAFIFSIDINPCEQEQQTLFDLELDYLRVVRVLGKSEDIGKHWPYRCDMLFVDGDHTLLGCLADCNAWLDKTDIAVFHDYMPENAPPKNQVYQVVKEKFYRQKPIIRAGSLIGFKV